MRMVINTVIALHQDLMEGNRRDGINGWTVLHQDLGDKNGN